MTQRTDLCYCPDEAMNREAVDCGTLRKFAGRCFCHCHAGYRARVIAEKDRTERDVAVQLLEADLVMLANIVYEQVLNTIQPYESRGFNAHQRAQSIAELVKDQSRDWLVKNFSACICRNPIGEAPCIQCGKKVGG